MAANNNEDPFQVISTSPSLKPWSRWSWKLTTSVETKPKQLATGIQKISDNNVTLGASIPFRQVHDRSLESEATFSLSSKEDEDSSCNDGHDSNSDSEVFFGINDDMPTLINDTSSESSLSQPSTPVFSRKSDGFESQQTLENTKSLTQSEYCLFLRDTSAELKVAQSPISTTATTNKEDDKEDNEEHSIAGNGLKDMELSPRQFALEKRRIMIKKLTSSRMDELVEVEENGKFRKHQKIVKLGSAFAGWTAFPEYLKTEKTYSS